MGQQAAENIALLREAYAAWDRSKGGSVAQWLALMADNVSVGSIAAGTIAELPFATQYESRNALADYFEGLLRDWRMIHYSPQEFVAQGNTVVMRGAMAWRNRSTGKVFATPKIDFWRMRNGKVIEFFEYFDSVGAQQAAR